MPCCAERITGRVSAVFASLLFAACVPLDVPEPACFDHSECADGLICVDRICVAAADEGPDVTPVPDVLPDLPDAYCIPPEPCLAPGLLGPCAGGLTACDGRCVPSGTTPQVEVCNDIDDDCDGSTDEGTVAPDPCPVDGAVGRCAMGVRACVGGAVACRASAPGETVPCDDIDDDCDGTADELAPTECAARVGDCQARMSTCLDGEVTCPPQVGANSEVCDGRDNDCDGAVDEDAAGLDGTPPLSPCEPRDNGNAAGQGFCAIGRMLCHQTKMQCVPWLPAIDVVDGMPESREVTPCDLLDQDCDGDADEGGEVHVIDLPPDPDGWVIDARAVAALVEQIGPRPLPGDGPRGQPGALPWPHGDAFPGDGRPPIHACLPAACLETCADAPEDELEACLAAAIADGGDCQPPPGVGAWSCAAGIGGPQCQIRACQPRFALDGGRCRPLEICNNGLDDDGDGLVDGTLGDPDACEAILRTAGEPVVLGACADRGLPGCDLGVGGVGLNSDEVCVGPACPFTATLTYDYAIDREEVSNRAFRECVESGCCSAPLGALYKAAEAVLVRPDAPERPLPDAREARPAPVSLEAIIAGDPAVEHLLPDLPVTGVTWCQARDFCHWAGKRLITEAEWERAAAGAFDARRLYPWGPVRPAACPDDDCCVDADLPEEEHSPMCLMAPVCDPAAPGEAGQRAWFAGYGMSEGPCDRLIRPGIAPVWGFPDGRTPDGVGNLAGNVGEWVFDRMIPGIPYRFPVRDANGGVSLVGVSAVDPVGLACMPAVDGQRAPETRGLRGGMFPSPAVGIRATNRTAWFPSSRLPFVGFRCARTIDEDASALRASDMPRVTRICNDELEERRLAAGTRSVLRYTPSYVGIDGPAASEAIGCGGPRHTETCGTDFACGADAPAAPGCGAFIIDRLEVDRAFGFDPDDPDELRGEAVGALDALFDTALAPAGGTTFIVLDMLEGFGLDRAETPVRVGTAIASQGRLKWVGLNAPGAPCEALPVATLPPMSVAVNGMCCALDDADRCNRVEIGREPCPTDPGSPMYMLLQESPVGLQIGNVQISETAFFPREGRLSGRIRFYINRADAERGIFGDPARPGPELLDAHLALPDIDFCDPLQRNDQACNQEARFTGCDGGRCVAGAGPESTCNGWALDFGFEAIRLDRALAERRVPGLDDMACAAPTCPE